MAYNGRRGPNVSEYIANLNAIPTPQDLHNSNQDTYNVDDELAMFTNTEFYDIDSVLQAPNFDGVGAQSTADSVDLDLKDIDFSLPG